MILKRVIFSVLILLCSNSTLNAQILNNVTKPSLTKYSLAEKVYLQMDNVIYQTGETIWFKAVVSKSYDNSPSDTSEILYVELIDFNKTIIEKKLLKLKKGIASGFFELQKGNQSGKYLIRAYTNWNRNFEDDFIFTQSIDVINLKESIEVDDPIINVVIHKGENNVLTADISPRVVNPRYKGKLKLYIEAESITDSLEINKDKNNLYRLNYKLPQNATKAKLKFDTQILNKMFKTNRPDIYSKTIVIDQNYLDIQFFPEGGKLVNGLISTVAFKSINYNGLGHKISGSIKDGQDNLITAFNSNTLGLGTFKLLPEIGKNYYAEVSVNDIIYKYNLPIAKNTGSVLSVVKLKDEIRLLLTSKDEIEGGIKIQTESRGVKYHDFDFKKKDTIIALLPSKSLPDGIIKISVLNNRNQTICERIVFNTKSSNRLGLNADLDNTKYLQRDKTTLKISIHDSIVSQNISLSVLVLDKDRLEHSKQVKSNILSHLLLSSELKGFIENSNYYFDTSNKTRTLDLDALMLTQGWRDYKYQNTKPTTNYRFKPEKSLVVSGTIGQYFNPKKRPKNPLDINMIVYGETFMTYNQEIDSNGKYHFNVDDFNKPKADLFMQVVNKKGEPIDFKINIDKKWKPKINAIKDEKIKLPESVVLDFIEKVEVTNKKLRDYETLYNTTALDEVELRPYKLTPARKKSIELHGEPTAVFDGKKLKEITPSWNFGLYDLIRIKYPDIVRIRRIYPPSGPSWLYARTVNSDFSFILVDNQPINWRQYTLLETIPVSAVKSVDIIEKPKNPTRYLFDVFGTNLLNTATVTFSYINIYTHSGNGFNGVNDAEGVRIDYVQGFSEIKEFYAPEYETLSNQDWIIPDNRSVIHWAPNIQLNNKGEYVLEYFNDDHTGQVSISVEAISTDGKIGYVEKTYTIKEAER